MTRDMVAVDIAAWLWGPDSRDGRDWQDSLASVDAGEEGT